MTLVAIVREGVLGACPFEVLHIISFSLDYWSIYWHLCSTIALYHVIFRSGWTSRAHLMYPVLSYQVVAPHHAHLLMNMTALMVCILRVKEKGNECASQAIDIDSRSKLQQFSDWLKTRPSARDNKTASQDEMCSPEWVLKKQPALWMASWNVKAIVASQVCRIEQALLQSPKCRVMIDFPGLCLLTILSMGGMMGPQYVELERDFTLLLWLGISMNDNLSQKQGVHCRLSVNSKWAHYSVSYCD